MIDNKITNLKYPWLRKIDNGILIEILVMTECSKTRIMGSQNERLLIQLECSLITTSIDKTLINFLADVFDIPTVQISIVASSGKDKKTVSIDQISTANAIIKLS